MNLDDPKIYKQYDLSDMLSRLHEMPAQCEKAWQMALDFKLPAEYRQINKVVVLGMGGSAIGSDLASSLLLHETKLPFFVHRDSTLPSFVDSNTLVVASSYSGNTEETLTAFAQAKIAGAKRLAITTGGKLGDLARQENFPAFTYVYPTQPRVALPYGILPIICFLQQLGFIRDKSSDVAQMVRALRGLTQRIDHTVPTTSNAAKQLANNLHNHLPVIYGAGIFGPVARRWKAQFNENSKVWAFYEVFPELGHNAVVGCQFPPDMCDKAAVIVLRSSLLPARLQERYTATCRLVEEQGATCRFADGEGDSELAQMMSLVMLGDYTSYYLAMLYGTDPTPVTAIDRLKQQLS